MVGFFKKLSDRLTNKMLAPGAEESDGYYDEYYDEYDDDYYDEPEPAPARYKHEAQPRKSQAKQPAASARTPLRSYGAKDNVFGFTGGSMDIHKQSESIIVHPKNMEDAVEIGSHVRSGRMCIVDLTGVPTSEAQRIADYLCGNSDALDGAITRVNNSIITVSPPNHRVMPDYREEGPFNSKFLKAANDR